MTYYTDKFFKPAEPDQNLSNATRKLFDSVVRGDDQIDPSLYNETRRALVRAEGSKLYINTLLKAFEGNLKATQEIMQKAAQPSRRHSV